MKSKISIKPVILCGGSGSRLWPLSRSGFPKQFLSLFGSNSLFQQAVERINKLHSDEIVISDTIIVTGEDHRFIAQNQLHELSISVNILLEPEAKNTAPALTLASLHTQQQGEDSVLVVIPADQIIQDNDAYMNALQNAIKVATSGSIVILGVKPTSPETGFGYIRHSESTGENNEFDVVEFVEKPNLETAKLFISTGMYSWNGGMFLMRTSVWIKAIKKFRPDIYETTKASYKLMEKDQQFIRPDKKLFNKIPAESIDYAVIEKCSNSEFNLKMILLDAGWSDLGSWNAVWELSNKDLNGNHLKGDVITDTSFNNLIYSNHRLVSTLGVKNLVIIETSDAVLVADKDQSQEVKQIVSKLKDQKREEHILHRKVSRPWGWYDTIDVGDRFKVKRIQVNPGSSLSLQRHTKRAEHWIVVKGSAKVTCGDKVLILNENESTFIPLGENHRLSNPSSEPLEIIEVQSGSYFGEDDIIRLDDGYGRN
jgi:mannose-1-phosphate guanylyltransferase/mannose-6-phosphate isomerase